MGAVFHGIHLGLGRPAAIKVLHPEFASDPHIGARFEREARSISRLDHPNCVRITDYGTTDDGTQFMAMQLLDGIELGTRLGSPLPAEEAVAMAIQILEGLEHAHRRGVVHRDLKPANVLIVRDDDGREVIKLVDFSIAKILQTDEGDRTLTQVGVVFGTPVYMSPEQATGLEVDGRADLYAVGILLYEMLTGAPPFDGNDPIAVARMQVTKPPPPLPPSVPPELAAVVEGLLAKHADDRPADAKEVINALERAVSPGAPPATTRVLEHDGDGDGGWGRLWARHRTRIYQAAAGVVFVAVGWFLVGPGASDADPQPAAVTRPEAKAPSGPSAEQLADLDRALAREADRAKPELARLLDAHPGHPQLLWRQGRLLAGDPATGARAIAAYAAAIDGNPNLLDDVDFYAQLLDLLRRPELLSDALDLSLRKMGRRGDTFLLELVNRVPPVLGYADRHRVLDRLTANLPAWALVDHRLHRALDLRQAGESKRPCETFGEALAAMEKRPELEDLADLREARAPTGDAAACADLEQRRRALEDRLSAGDTGLALAIEPESDAAPADVAPVPAEPAASGVEPAPEASGSGQSGRSKKSGKTGRSKTTGGKSGKACNAWTASRLTFQAPARKRGGARWDPTSGPDLRLELVVGNQKRASGRFTDQTRVTWSLSPAIKVKPGTSIRLSVRDSDVGKDDPVATKWSKVPAGFAGGALSLSGAGGKASLTLRCSG